MEILKHLVRTLIHIAALLAICGFIFLVTLKLGLPHYVKFFGVMAVILAYVIWSGRMHAYWAPISKRVNAFKWKTVDGRKMETVVEKAIVQAGGYIRTETLRVSIYELESGRRIARIMIGDDATYLGRHGIGIWFHIADRYHARRDGLVCLDVKTGKWLHHVPRSEIPYLSPTKSHSVFSIEDREENPVGEINLAELEANIG